MSKQTFRLRNNFILNILFSCSSVSLALFGLLTFVPPYNPEKQAEAVIDPDLYTISVNAVSDISLQVNPSAAGTVAMVEDVITSSTNSPSGYKLYVSVDGDHNDIYLNGDSNNDVSGKKIAATSGTFDSPAALTSDSSSSWGYAVPGLNNFDIAYDPSSPSSSAKFAALPVIGEEQLIHEHEGVATDDTTSVYYGAKVDSNIAAGHYVANVVYTSMTDISSITNGELTVSPNDFTENYDPVTITITTSLSTSREIGTVTATVGGNICGDLDIANYDPLTVTCTLPAGLSNSRHDVMLNIPRLGKSYETEGGIKVSASNHTCTKQYRLQNADGTYPDEYTQDTEETETIAHGETCSYAKSVDGYQGQNTTITPDEDVTLSLDLPRNTYELTIHYNQFIASVSGAGTYRWGEEVSVSAVSTGEKPFRGWEQMSGETSSFADPTAISTTFVMPKSSAVIFADGGRTCDYDPDHTWTFGYTGAPESFDVPCVGAYKIEAWGASGGSASAIGHSIAGGRGGYAVGNLVLTTDDTLYIGVGGAGAGGSTTARNAAGGWNGGASGHTETPTGLCQGGGGGGGATHVAVADGALPTLSASDVLIVAGGGTAAYVKTAYSDDGEGIDSSATGKPGGATVSPVGTTMSPNGSTYRTGGGSGYAGGGGGYIGGSGSAGGASYFASSVRETSFAGGNSVMPTHDGTGTMTGNSGSGYAKITFIGEAYQVIFDANGGNVDIASKTLDLNNNIMGDMPVPTKNGEFFWGWYTDTTYKTLVTTTSVIKENMRLYARWGAQNKDFDYQGYVEGVRVPTSGTYKVELWGASGGTANPIGHTIAGGRGGYVTGNVYLTAGSYLYIGVGGAGAGTSTTYRDAVGGFNGGTSGHVETPLGLCRGGGAGGGATHIATADGTLPTLSASNVMIVAGGGSGGYGRTNYSNDGEYIENSVVGGAGGVTVSPVGTNISASGSSFHIGGEAGYSGGGGGYVGGSGSTSGTSYFSESITSTSSKSGNESMPTHDGAGTMTGNSGSGYAKLTYLGN